MDRFITQIGRSGPILVFIIIIGLVLGYLDYYGSEPFVFPDDFDLSKGGHSIESLANFNLDFSILDNKSYKSLEIFGENPVDPGVTGERRNPFVSL